MMSCNKTTQIKAALSPVETDDVVDPSQIVGSVKYVILDNLLGKLVNINAAGDYEFMLAENIVISNDLKNFTIYLNKNAYFSDGKPITSRDVANSLWRLAKLGSLHIPFKTFLDNETPSNPDRFIKIISEKELKVTFDKPCKEFIYYMTLADAGILPDNLINKNEIVAKDHFVTSGAYRYKDGKLLKNDRFIKYKDSAPDEIIFSAPKNAPEINYKDYDIGLSYSFDKNDPENWNLQNGFKYASSNFQTHAFLLLNVDHPKFKDVKTRQQINLAIQKGYQVVDNPFFLKSHQFFIPNSFAFQEKFNTAKILEAASVNIEESRPSFNISAQIVAKNFVAKDIEKQLETLAGSNIDISFSDKGDQYLKRKKDRDFEAYVVVTSMSYRVLTESLNLLYFSPNSFAKNPNGKIKKMIQEFHSTTNAITDRVVEEISHEMALESEVIPLNYASSPIFYNSSKLDISELNTTESLTFWKLNVK